MLRNAFIVAVAVLASGCRSDPYAEVREREWRRLEDEIYYREDIIADLEAQLESCRRENDALRRRNGTSEASEPLPLPQYDTPPDVPPEMIDDFRPPKTELGTEGPPPLGRTAPRQPRPIRLAGGVALSSTGTAAAPAKLPAADVAAVADGNSPVVSLKLSRRLTGGNDADGRLGDEGILAVVEARDAEGRLVASPGAMSLALYDPLASGDRGIVARWDFTTDEVAARFRDGPFGSGIHFELPWPNRPPRRPQVRLAVTCRTPEGKSLSATHKFTVDLPRERAQHAEASLPTSHAERPTAGSAGDDGEGVGRSLPPWRPTRP